MRMLAMATGRRVVDVLAPDGMVLGLNLDRGERFERYLEEVTIPLAAGDTFFFFTDGVSEAMDAGGECFGESAASPRSWQRMPISAPEAIRDGLAGRRRSLCAGRSPSTTTSR